MPSRADLVRLADQIFADPEQAIAVLEAGIAAADSLDAAVAIADRTLIIANLLLRLGAIYEDRRAGDRADNIEKALAAFEKVRSGLDRDVSPALWARAAHSLGRIYPQRIVGDRADNFEGAIAACNDALEVWTRESFPREWAATHCNLAIAYSQRIHGEAADNLEEAIRHYEAALATFTRETAPDAWAKVQINRAATYSQRIAGEKAENIEQAIAGFEAALTVITRDAFPEEWGIVHHNLATCFQNRIRGERLDNLERAIALYQAALTVRTRDAAPLYYALTHNNLANTYADRIRGLKAENLEHAIAHFEAALSVFTKETFPYEWGLARNNLALAYWERGAGTRVDNLESAMAHAHAALSVFTADQLPQEWAAAQSTLAIVLQRRIRGNKGENIVGAIKSLDETLKVWSRESFPYEWARAQLNLAHAYETSFHITGGDGIERAIACNEAALTVLRRESFPREWSILNYNLGNCHRKRACDASDRDLDHAINHFELALTVRTRAALPREHVETCHDLGQAFLKKRDWLRATAAFAQARESFLLLFDEGLDEAEAQGLIEIAGSLFSNAAYAAAELGEGERAFALVCEGKARLLATALRLQALSLPEPSQQRLDALRTKIREQSRLLQQSQGLARAETVDRLTRLRAELSNLSATARKGLAEPGAMMRAEPLLAQGYIIVTAVVTEVGGKLLVLLADAKGPNVTVIDLPGLTTRCIAELMRGDATAARGWLAAFARGVSWSDRVELVRTAVEQLGTKLWALLAGPLEQVLADRGVATGTTLIFLPSSGLGLLPLGLAEHALGGRRLIDDYEIVYAPSLEALVPAIEEDDWAPALTAIANPTGDLLFAPIESTLVAAHFDKGRRTLLDAGDATPDAVLAALKGRTHWHFATHGLFDQEEPRRSALVMKDGECLSVERLLQADDLGRPRLVVLSACETGLHEIERTPEEFIGLPGAFMTVGARAVLSTLWPVNDCATALLSARFYDLHLEQGLAPATALRQAQFWLRSATRKDLVAYARASGDGERLSAEQINQFIPLIENSAVTAMRFFADSGSPVATSGRSAPPGSDRADRDGERPFAHPVHWGGFVLTGL